MASTRHSEDDLRAALGELGAVDTDDVTALRARLDARLAAGDQPREDEVDTAAGEVLDLVAPAGRARRGRLGRRTAIVTAGAVAAVAAAAVVAVVVSRPADRADSPPADPHPTTSSASSGALGAGLLPKSTVVDEFDLHGTQHVTVGAITVPKGYVLLAVTSCSGDGGLRIGSGGEDLLKLSACSGGTVFSTDITSGQALSVTTGNSTRWRLRIVVSPDLHTNASMYGDEDMQTTPTGDLPAGDPGRRVYSGDGAGTVRLTMPTGTTRARVDLRCSSTSVLDGWRLTGTAGADLTVEPCLPGLTFVWTGVRVHPSQTLRVSAPAGVHWLLNVEDEPR